MKIQKFSSLKKILIALLLCISASQSIAQNSNGIFFQAVARDNFSNPAKDRNIYVESSILQTTVNGTKVLVELHKTKTDAMGVFNITIGNGQRTGGSSTSIATIDWSKGPFYLNLKIAITPFSASDSWDYSKELVDIGTTSFGAVPFAFYSASSAKVSDKLDATDTTKMLAVYAKAMSVKTLETSVATKLTAADTLTMLAPYAKVAYTIDSNFFRSQLATKLNIADTINYTKQKYTDSAFSKKLNIADSTKYVTPTKLAANLFDQTPLKNEIATKLNIADSTKYVTLTKLASYYTSSAGSGTTIDTASLSNRINLKASTSDVTNAIALNTSAITTNTNAITANEIATNAVTSDKIIANAITTGKIQASAITADQIAVNAITATKLAANSVTTEKIEALAVTAERVAANAITAGKIAVDAVTAGVIAAGAITSDKLAANSVIAGKIAAGAVSASNISTTNLSSINSNLGAITGGSINIASKFIVDGAGNTTIQSGTSGARTLITNEVIKVFDASGVLRIHIGNLSA